MDRQEGSQLRLAGAAAVVMATSCVGSAGLPAVAPVSEATPEVRRAPLRVVSVADDRSPTDSGPGARRLLLVVDQSLDPLSVRADNFIVVTAAGSRAVPTEAMFAGMSRLGVQRSVTLAGDFGEGLPQALLVVGEIFATSGAVLHRESSPVEASDARPRVLFWETRPPEAGDPCDDGAGVVQVWWSRSVRRGEVPLDLGAVKEGGAEGSALEADVSREVFAPYYAFANSTKHCVASDGASAEVQVMLVEDAVRSAAKKPSERTALKASARLIRPLAPPLAGGEE